MSVERRAYPRYPVDLKMRVRPSGPGGDFTADATMLSRSSVQVMCEADLVMALLKQAEPPYLCDLEFRLPTAELVPVPSAQLLTHRRVSQQHYVLVFLFKGLDAQHEVYLDRLLEVAVPSHLR